MKIKLARIDDRLIHGQVATVWSRVSDVSRIIVVSDEVSNDKVRVMLLKQVAPTGITVSVVNIEKGKRVYDNKKYENDKVMLLFTNPTDVLRLVKLGVDIKSVNIGGMSYKEGKKQITKAISVDYEDIESFKELDQLGIELEIRPVPDDKKKNIMKILEE
ncbi:mannose/fructose/sorbose PTS transporter subunit IIB [Anaerococcus hydrogenalis]|uniref:mannose/fructose/sorbose PTS transporter subunit IIB n=1 Tax=Anaerococcus hydrogenalis TaxID=33029 RepID=UPI0023F18554|nr:mannose/fructose/sorbose PTS transporter subunit IIB [Anaerococcus hydrogenalis]